MLGSLTGRITAQLEQRILLEVGGVGYWVFTGSWHPQGEVTCYLYHRVQEDASDLYGFPDLTSLELFEKLLGVSGVGPKAALALLSLGPPERLAQAIQAQDAAYLSSAPGIGSKAAQKIILELHSKLGLLAPRHELYRPLESDLLAALESLGYKRKDLYPLLQQMPPEHASLDAQLKWMLQQLAA